MITRDKFYYFDAGVYTQLRPTGVLEAASENAGLAFEIKHAKIITPKMLHGLREFKQDYPIAELYIVYLGEAILSLADGDIVALPMPEALKKLPEFLEFLR